MLGYEPCDGCAELEAEAKSARRTYEAKIAALEAELRTARAATASAAETTATALSRLIDLEKIADAAERWYASPNAESELAALVVERLRAKRKRS